MYEQIKVNKQEIVHHCFAPLHNILYECVVVPFFHVRLWKVLPTLDWGHQRCGEMANKIAN